jgi:hypothetical protein
MPEIGSSGLEHRLRVLLKGHSLRVWHEIGHLHRAVLRSTTLLAHALLSLREIKCLDFFGRMLLNDHMTRLHFRLSSWQLIIFK